MRRNFNLIVKNKKGNFNLEVCIEKCFGERVSLKTGYNNKPLKWIKVSVNDPELEKITSVDEIEHIVQANEIENIYPTGEEDDDGNPKYITIDKNTLKRAFQSTAEMTVMKTVPLTSIPFNYIDDAHYFLNVKKTKKGKQRVANIEDETLYSVLYQGLKQYKETFLVRYYSMNTVKHGIIYAKNRGLMLSNLIATTYQKSRQEEQKLKIATASSKLYDKLVEKSRDDTVGELEDEYGKSLEELIEATLQGKTIKEKPEKTHTYSKLSLLLEDNSDEDETPVKIEKLKKKK